MDVFQKSNIISAVWCLTPGCFTHTTLSALKFCLIVGGKALDGYVKSIFHKLYTGASSRVKIISVQRK